MTLTRDDSVVVEKAKWDLEKVEAWLRGMELRSLKLSGKVGLYASDEF